MKTRRRVRVAPATAGARTSRGKGTERGPVHRPEPARKRLTPSVAMPRVPRPVPLSSRPSSRHASRRPPGPAAAAATGGAAGRPERRGARQSGPRGRAGPGRALLALMPAAEARRRRARRWRRGRPWRRSGRGRPAPARTRTPVKGHACTGQTLVKGLKCTGQTLGQGTRRWATCRADSGHAARRC
jgi:hypothetical protein